eukprot:scaffold190503_cov58-Attheya_sp.AAC.4
MPNRLRRTERFPTRAREIITIGYTVRRVRDTCTQRARQANIILWQHALYGSMGHRIRVDTHLSFKVFLSFASITYTGTEGFQYARSFRTREAGSPATCWIITLKKR